MRVPWFEWRHATLADRTVCRQMIRDGSKSFHAASKLLPADLRDPAYAVYAFCRIADDAVDDAEAHADATERLRVRLDGIYEGAPRDHPVDRTLADVVSLHKLPRPLFDALIEGLEWDQAGRVYDTIEDLHAYSARVASAVGAIMTCLMGRRAPATLARACDLGVAMQLTNIARDVGEDARRGRVYLPTQWLRDEGLSRDGLIADPVFTPALGRVVARLLADADELYAASRCGIAGLPLACRPSINAARRLYAAIGDEIAANGYDSVSRRAVVPLRRKLSIAAVAAVEAYIPAGRACEDGLDATRFLVAAVREHGADDACAMAEAESGAEWIVLMLHALEERERERLRRKMPDRAAVAASASASASEI
jgi:phytoene synthase